MQIRIGFGAMIVLVATAAVLLVATRSGLQDAAVRTAVESADLPVVMRTPGGLLEVAVVRAVERFTREDTKAFWGVPLGTTVSQVQAPVVYRYHVELAREWTVTLRGTTAIVRSPALRPSLPAAFDSGAMWTHSESGWARFNKADNLAALQRSMTAELDRRAHSPRYLALATGAARETVREFVTQWLLKEQGWTRDPSHVVQVLFPGEPLPRPGGAPPGG